MKRALIFLTAMVLSGHGFSTSAPAQEQPLAILVSDIDLGLANAPSESTGGANSVGSNGILAYAPGFSGGGMGTAGSAQINGTPGLRTVISCEAAKTMSNLTGVNGRADQAVSAFYLALGNAAAVGPGQGIRCLGLDEAVIDQPLPEAASQRVLLAGMTMDANDVMSGGEYRLSTHAGGELVIRIRQMDGADITAQVDLRMDAKASFIKDVSLSASAMAFGAIEAAGTPGPGDSARMGTNGAIAYDGAFSGSGQGTPGSVTISGTVNGTMLEVYCSSDAILSSGSGAASIALNQIEVSTEDTIRPHGAGARCSGQGAGPALHFTFQSGSRDQVFVGGRLDGAVIHGSAGLDGSFSTVNPGGRPIEVEIIIP